METLTIQPKRILVKALMVLVLATVLGMEIVSPSGVIAKALQSDNAPFGTLYWSTKTTIEKVDLNSSMRTTLISGLSNAFGVKIDVSGGKLYWADAGTEKIQRANLDGSQVEDVVTGIKNPIALALDLDAGKVYWTVSPTLKTRRLDENRGRGFGKIQRANLDGSQVEDLLTKLGQPSAISLDTTAGKMYWTDVLSPGLLRRANLDGSEGETIARRIGLAAGVALDTENGKVYWAYRFSRIERANLDGTDVESLIDGGQGSGIAYSVHLDVAANKLYFMHIAPDDNNDLTTITIRQANLDGSQAKVIFSDVGDSVWDLALGM